MIRKDATTQPLTLKVWGELACFTRPEAHVERVSYSVMTPSAARGILEAIFWKPEFSYQVRTIRVLNPVRYFSIKRNELKAKMDIKVADGWSKTGTGGFYSDDTTRQMNRVQRHTLALRDVAYVIEADIVLRPHAVRNTEKHAPDFWNSFVAKNGRTPTDDEVGNHLLSKYRSQFRRRVEAGQCHHQPCFGCREFIARFGKPDGEEQTVALDQQLGSMLFDIRHDLTPDGSGFPLFFDAQLRNGTLDVPGYLYGDGGAR